MKEELYREFERVCALFFEDLDRFVQASEAEVKPMLFDDLRIAISPRLCSINLTAIRLPRGLSKSAVRRPEQLSMPSTLRAMAQWMNWINRSSECLENETTMPLRRAVVVIPIHPDGDINPRTGMVSSFLFGEHHGSS